MNQNKNPEDPDVPDPALASHLQDHDVPGAQNLFGFFERLLLKFANPKRP